MEPLASVETLLVHDAFVRGLAERLLADAHEADDAAQQAWLTALQSGAAPRGSVRAWLAAVLRNSIRQMRRASRRRATHELGAAASAEVPSASTIVEREAARKTILDAVLALERDYQAAILLRFYQGCSHADAARRLGIPVETLRTRLKRGLKLLRERLEREYGGERERWMRALLPFTVVPIGNGATTSNLVREDTRMLLLKWIAALVITAAGAMFTWTSLLPHAEPQAPKAVAAPAAPPPLTQGRGQPERTPVVPRTDPGKDQAQDGGSIIAQVVRPDGTAARDMGVCLVREDVAQVGLTAREAAIGDDGTCRFDGLAPGRYCVTLNPDRQSRTVIVAGAGEQAVTLSADQGYHVDGMVVDDQGQAVAGALVWVGGYPPLDESGQVVTTAASDGSFHLDGLMETAMIAARKPGMSPSPAQCLLWLVKQKATPIAINLVLGAASGAVCGRVVDAAGTAVAGALVEVGRPRAHVQDGVFTPPPSRVRSDAHGEFCVPGLAAGTTDVRAGAIGCAVARVAVDVVAGETTQAVLTLSAGATLCGRVTADGSPWPGSITVDFRRGYPLTCAQAAANVNGEYRLEHLAEGEFQAIASIGGAQTATIELTAHGTETLTWSPAFTTSTMIAGRLLDARDVPLAGWRLSAIPDAGVRVVVDAITDAQGRFTMPRVGTGEHVLMVHGRLPPDGSISMAFAMLVEHVRPSSNDVVIHFAEPSAWIKGTLATPEGDAPDTAITEITASMREFPAMITRADAESGEFALGPLGAGTYHVSAGAVGFESQDLGRLTLAADQTIDVGVLVLKRR